MIKSVPKNLQSNALRLAAIALSCLIANGAFVRDADASCSSKELAKLKAAGFNTSQVARICDIVDHSSDDESQESPSKESSQVKNGGGVNRCVTPTVSCMTPEFAPRGTPCWCNTPAGPVTGEAN